MTPITGFCPEREREGKNADKRANRRTRGEYSRCKRVILSTTQKRKEKENAEKSLPVYKAMHTPSVSSVTFSLSTRHIYVLFNSKRLLLSLAFEQLVRHTLTIRLGDKHANLRQNTHRQDDHSRSRTKRHDRKCQGQDPRQGRYPARSATSDLRRQTTRRRPNTLRLQHPKGINAPLGAPSPWWHANLRQDPHRQDDHPRSRAK